MKFCEILDMLSAYACHVKSVKDAFISDSSNVIDLFHAPDAFLICPEYIMNEQLENSH